MGWTVSPRYVGAAVSDADAQTYLRAVEAADGQALELGVQQAVNQFVLGCKADGIWNAIKASCILAGARTLTGALVPLVGTAPTSYNFVSGDYNRKTGLVGDGSTKYLDSNRNNNSDPQNSKHGAVYVSTVPASSSSGTNAFPCYLGTGANVTGAFTFGRFNANSANLYSRANNAAAATISSAASSTGLIGQVRSLSTAYIFRHGLSNQTVTQPSESPFNGNLAVFREGAGLATATTYSNARLSFYSIGESLDLALLDTRVTTLMSALTAAIP